VRLDDLAPAVGCPQLAVLRGGRFDEHPPGQLLLYRGPLSATKGPRL